MNTTGHGNDGVMIVVPVGVAIIVAMILFGGPAETLEAVNDLLRGIAGLAKGFVDGLFSDHRN